jgi:hypothetical protein
MPKPEWAQEAPKAPRPQQQQLWSAPESASARPSARQSHAATQGRRSSIGASDTRHPPLPHSLPACACVVPMLDGGRTERGNHSGATDRRQYCSRRGLSAAGESSAARHGKQQGEVEVPVAARASLSAGWSLPAARRAPPAPRVRSRAEPPAALLEGHVRLSPEGHAQTRSPPLPNQGVS